MSPARAPRGASSRPPVATRSLEVHVGLGSRSVQAGRATFRMRGATLLTEFTYLDGYLADPLAYPLSPSLPFQRAAHVTEGLPAPFADSSPDWWGRNLISRRLRAGAIAAGEPAPLVTEFDFLTGVSDRTRQGAVRFRDATRDAFVAEGAEVPLLVDLADIMAAAERVAGLQSGRESDALDAEFASSESTADQSSMKLLLQAGTATLGGARPKASVLDRGALAIAKFPHPQDQWDVMTWEKTALDLAELAGVPVPARRLEQIDGRAVLILERFDRADDQRIGFVSALTLLNESSSPGHDYVDLSAAIADHSADAGSDLVDLWRRMAFSVAIHNTDDHMRNHGFLRGPSGWRLSPAFDINPNPELAEPRSSSIIGVTDARSEVGALFDCAAYFGLTEQGARAITNDIVAAVGDWERVAAGNGIDPARADRFAQTFAHQLEQLRAA